MVTILLSLVCATALSFFLIPVVKKVGAQLDIVAKENERTVHHGKIVRIGGVAIYSAFMICAAIFLKADTQINAIMIGGFIIEMMGLIDDIHNLPAKVKLLFQIIAASVIIFYGGISLSAFRLPFFSITFGSILSIIVTYGWIIGITNALNIIDGLDGLCAGISIISLVTISMISLTFHRTDICALNLILAGSIGGFLCYNLYPASIFMGDCGSQFIGFMISVISLLGFGYKSSLFFTLGAPIVVLAVPIMDTIIAIIRRKLAHQSFATADKGHLHHQLMINLDLGMRNSVFILYGATFLFSASAYIYLYNRAIAIALFVFLLLVFEIFVEYTKMLSQHYYPILATLNLILKSDKLPSFTRGENSIRSLIKKNLQRKQEQKHEEND